MKKYIYKWMFILFIGFLMAPKVWAATSYYIDWETGSDSNDGLTKESPWKHAPGMQGGADNCALTYTQMKATPQGNRFILKGGVTWPNEALGWIVNFNGVSTDTCPGCSGDGCIYIGVDKTWYSGENWSRPILDAQGKHTATDSGGVSNYLLRIYANFVEVDSIEFKGLYWDNKFTNYGESVNIHLAAGTSGRGEDVTLNNLYIHGWTHGTYANGSRQRSCCIIGDTGTPNNNARSIVRNSVFDGSDTAKDSGSGIFGGPPYIINNYFNEMSNGMIVCSPIKIFGNTILNIGKCFDPTAHINAIEINPNLAIKKNFIV